MNRPDSHTDTVPGRDEEAREAKALADAFTGTSERERERLGRIVDLLPCYVVLIDEKHRIRFHNQAFEQFFGPPDDRPCYAALRGQNRPCRLCPPFDFLRKEGIGVMEWVHPMSGRAFRVHSYPFTDDDGSRCVLKAGFNITASLRVQHALDLSEQSYRAITDNLSIGISLLDTNLRIKAGNARLNQWFGDGFRLDRRICELLHCGQDHAKALADPAFTCPDCPFQASTRDGASHEKEMTVCFQDGMERIVRLVTCPVKPRKGRDKVRALIMMLEDITNRLRVNQQLQRARKLEAMNTLAGGIAHEINQPLSALHLYAGGLQMLLEKQEATPLEMTRERLGLIMSEADKIRSIISHMRTLVMEEEPAPLDGVALAPAVDNALGIMRRQMKERGIRLEADIPATLPLVRSNEVQLEQVLVNLLANAMHALDTVEPGREAPRREVRVRARMLPGAGRVRLEVADSGPGLPGGGENIFDPFFTTKERHEGMGLGLSIVHGLVSLWGGEISTLPADPDLGGAVFLVDMLPAAEKGAVPSAGDRDAAGESAAPTPAADAAAKTQAAPDKARTPGPAGRNVKVRKKTSGPDAEKS